MGLIILKMDRRDIMKINFNIDIPIYIQIMEYFKREIGVGYLKPGDRIPSVRKIADELQVNSNTIQHAFKELEIEDIVITNKGRGRYVTNDNIKIMKLRKDMKKKLVCSFINGMKNLEFTEEEIIFITLSFLKNKN